MAMRGSVPALFLVWNMNGVGRGESTQIWLFCKSPEPRIGFDFLWGPAH